MQSTAEQWDDTTLMSPALALMARGMEDGILEAEREGKPRASTFWLALAYCLQPDLAPYERTQYEEGFLLGVLQSIQARRDVRCAG